jgi:hypothetical protein
MAGLEYELGNVTAEYVKVRLTYCHSGFPSLPAASKSGGVSSCQTRLETTATGVIKRYNPTSPWAVDEVAPAVSRTLFEVMTSHWGPVRANETMSRIMASRSRPRKEASVINLGDGVYDLPTRPERTGAALPLNVPRRTASLRMTKGGRTSSISRPRHHASRVSRVPGSSTDSSLPRPGNAAQLREEPESQSEDNSWDLDGRETTRRRRSGRWSIATWW